MAIVRSIPVARDEHSPEPGVETWPGAEPQPGVGVDADAFRHAFRRLATTVAVITIRDRTGAARAMTVTSMCGLSVSPPTLLVCIDRAASTHRELLATNRFGLDILADDQVAIAARFARRGASKLVPAGLLDPGLDGPTPHVAGSVVRFDCTISAIHAASTHDIVVGLIEAIDMPADDGSPLLYHEGGFAFLRPDRMPLALLDPADRPVPD
jgi:flavin reductase (DIM6/NTAB) family NADH-FMN oxidoreductase RutF